MSRARWTRLAEADAEGIYNWIAHHEGRRRTAKAILRELRHQCNDYADVFCSGSVIGTARPDLGRSLRVFMHKRWAVLFRPIDDGIEVLRVLDGSRDYPRLFSQ
jgi:toxin ParE1/3/4